MAVSIGTFEKKKKKKEEIKMNKRRGGGDGSCKAKQAIIVLFNMVRIRYCSNLKCF